MPEGSTLGPCVQASETVDVHLTREGAPLLLSKVLGDDLCDQAVPIVDPERAPRSREGDDVVVSPFFREKHAEKALGEGLGA